MMRAPDAPMGWPSAQAPPWTLTFVVGKAEIAHGGHGDDGEGLVDFEEIDFRKRPAGAVEQHADGADGRGGKERGRVGVGGVAGYGGQRLEAAAVGFRTAHEDQGGGTVGDGAGVCRR